jgi:two-component system, chemotaxis family, chemotaxis protein CheY
MVTRTIKLWKGVFFRHSLDFMKKILICDDSMTIRKKLTNALKSIIECDVFEAKDGNEAITMFDECNPDLVFMDIMMPEKDGLEAVAEILTLHPRAKIVMLSSVGTKDNLQKALKFGAIDFVQKPIENERLEVILSTHCKEA